MDSLYGAGDNRGGRGESGSSQNALCVHIKLSKNKLKQDVLKDPIKEKS